MKRTYNIDREEDTISIARKIAPHIRKGDILALSGELGSGKTFFTRYLCDALGVGEPVTSPSFVLMNQYEAPDFIIYHIDLFRLQTEEDVLSLGLDEIMEDGVTIIEWPGLAEKMFTSRVRRLSFNLTPKERSLTLETDENFLQGIG